MSGEKIKQYLEDDVSTRFKKKTGGSNFPFLEEKNNNHPLAVPLQVAKNCVASWKLEPPASKNITGVPKFFEAPSGMAAPKNDGTKHGNIWEYEYYYTEPIKHQGKIYGSIPISSELSITFYNIFSLSMVLPLVNKYIINT